MLTFLHTADWQIGRQYNRFEAEDAAILADARLTTIERIAELAATERVDAVLVAGDVFDAQTVSDRIIHRTFDAMKAYAGPWIMLPGNHDAALAESVWTRAQRLNAVPSNVHLLLTPGSYEFKELGVAVLAAPLTQRQTHADLTVPFDNLETSSGLIRIGLAHGSVSGILPDSVDSPNPISPQRAQTAGLSYLALGDWHGSKQIDERTWYSGTPEPERFRNNDAGNVLKVTIANAQDLPKVSQIPIAQHYWIEHEATLTVASDVDELKRQLEALPDRSVLNIRLQGQLDLNSHQALQSLLSAISGRHRSVQVHQQSLQLVPTAEDLAAIHADGYVGEVIESLKQSQQQADNELAGEALMILARELQSLEQEDTE